MATMQTVGTFGWWDAADTTATGAPTLSVSSVAATSVVLTHTAPADSDYSTTYVHYGERGGARIGSVTGSGGTISVTGLDEHTAYWFVAESRDTTGNKSIPSNVVQATTSASGTATTRLVVDLVAEAVAGVNTPPTVYKARIWRPAWDTRGSALIRFIRVEAEDGHGGIERRRYDVDVVLRYRRRDTDGVTRQPDILALAERIRAALHLADPSDFATQVTGLHQIRVDSPVAIPDDADDLDQDFIETTLPVALWTFEAA